VPVGFTEVLARTDELAICICGLVAFPAGFNVDGLALSRLDPPKEPFGLFARGRGLLDVPGGAFRFGIAFSDGTKVTDATRFGRSGPAEPANECCGLGVRKWRSARGCPFLV